MTTITFDSINFDKNNSIRFTNNTVFIEITGHTLFASKGNDIVCAALSTLAQVLVISIAKIVNIKQDIQQKEGLLRTKFKTDGLSEVQDIKIRTLLEHFYIGALELYNKYPGNVKIELK